jgi:hypothetical protein
MATGSASDVRQGTSRRPVQGIWTASQGRTFIRMLHLVLSIPILGYLYGPVVHIPQAAFFTRWIAMPLVVLSGSWLWLKPRIKRWLGLELNALKPPAESPPQPPAKRSAE